MRFLLLIVISVWAGCRHRPAAAPAAKGYPQRSRELEQRRTAAEAKRLYEAGVDAYAKGNLGEARRFFEEVLKLDPDDLQAQRAVRRLSQRERQER